MLIALLLLIHGYAFCKRLLKRLGILQANFKMVRRFASGLQIVAWLLGGEMSSQTFGVLFFFLLVTGASISSFRTT